MAIALYLGRDELARQVLTDAKAKRIAAQIMPNGSMPFELERTKSWDYSVYNLEAIVRLARLGERVGVDLWGYVSKDGRSISAALDYLLPYAHEPKTWPYEQIYEIELGAYLELLRHAATALGGTKAGERYAAAVTELGGEAEETSRERLIN